jgi:hypothetical protein
VAQLVTETITITLSKMVRNGDEETSRDILSTETLNSLLTVVEELAGDGVMVEIE